MSWITLLLQAIAAIPKLLTLLREVWAAVRKMQEKKRIDDVKEANNNGDTIKVEEGIGSPRAGEPSGIDGASVRRKG